MSDLPLALQLPPRDVIMRPVQSTDNAALHQYLWPERPLEFIDRLIARTQQNARQGRGLGIVACTPTQKQIYAFGQLTVWARCGEISDLIVSDRNRNQGTGTAIIQYLVRCSREMHLSCVEIGAALSNPRAIALYRRLGFLDHHQVNVDLGQSPEPVMYLRLTLIPD